MIRQVVALVLAAGTGVAAGRTLPAPDIVVAADGSGDFKTVQAALVSIPAANRERVLVHVKRGVYHEKVRVDAAFVTLRGEGPENTRIEYPQLNDDFARSPDELGRAVLNVNADDFVLDGLTVENTAGQIGPHAFTVYGKGDRTVLMNCDVLSHGADTVSLWLGERGRYYHANCRFQGSVDFVCPRGWCYVTNCTFFEMKPGSAAVWHDGSRGRDMKFVLRDCRFDGTNGWVLARHHADAQFYFIDCTFAETMADRPVKRVIYPLHGSAPSEEDIRKNRENDLRNRWGERNYFWNCRREGGDYAWHANHLAADGAWPNPEDITPAWTFAGRWNPERVDPPRVVRVQTEEGHVAVVFSEAVTVEGAPQLTLRQGAPLHLASGSGSETLRFEVPSGSGIEPVGLELRGGAILACEAGAGWRFADIRLPAAQ